MLSARIAGVHAGKESERQSRQDSLGSKIRTTQDHLARTQINADGQYKLTKEKLSKVGESIASETVALSVLDERQNKELELLDSSFRLESTSETEERKENELKFEKIISERLHTIHQELVQECQRIEAEEALKVSHLQDEIVKLKGFFEEEKKKIETSDYKLLAKTTEEVNGVEELLNAEIKVREETEKTMLKIIEESSNALHIETQANKRNREETHESLLRILEQTCLSVEQSIGK